MRHLGLNYSLNKQAYAAFYRKLVSENLGDGYVVLSTLTVGEEVVAILLGIRNGADYVMVRGSNAGEIWANCSPGRADHRAHHGCLVRGRRPLVRFLDRQLCLEAALRRCVCRFSTRPRR